MYHYAYLENLSNTFFMSEKKNLKILLRFGIEIKYNSFKSRAFEKAITSCGRRVGGCFGIEGDV